MGNTKSCGCSRAPIKLDKGEAGFRELYRSYQRDARRRKLDFELSAEEFKILATGPCDYCGSCRMQTKYSRGKPENPAYHFGAFKYTGVDRVDSSKGYAIDNCVSCCNICNIAKNSMSRKDFIAWIQRVHKHLRLL
jgi:5-methylcytosine-specific restriction endonuclease McrA